MSESANPYAAPLSLAHPGARVDSDGTGLWRDGDLLVMRRSTHLPNRCVRTGASTELPGIRRKYHWVPTWILLTIPLGPVALVLILLLQKRGVIDIPLCQQEHSERNRRMRIGGGIFAAGIACAAFLLAYFMT